MPNTEEKRTVYLPEELWGDLRELAGKRAKAEKRYVSVAELVRRGVVRELREGRKATYAAVGEAGP